MKRRRPKKWHSDESLTVDAAQYDMRSIHAFVLKCLCGLYDDLHAINIKDGLYKVTGCYGLYLPESYQIYVAWQQSSRELYITILHELFHYFFHDHGDKRETSLTHMEDPVERRAENSAINTLSWYEDNEKFYLQFRTMAELIPVTKLKKSDLEEI